jgi:hypothetical protein
MRGIVDKYLNDVNVTITSTEKSVDTSIIKDSTITQGLISLLSYAKDSVNRAEVYSNYNYLYTAANEAFLAKIYGMVISEVMDNPSIFNSKSTIYNLIISELEKKFH